MSTGKIQRRRSTLADWTVSETEAATISLESDAQNHSESGEPATKKTRNVSETDRNEPAAILSYFYDMVQ